MNKNFIRIIPRLDIKNGNLIKGINLEGLRILGDPYNFSNLYSDLGADEVSYLDNVATLYGTNNLTKFISKTAKNMFVPLSVGGGIKSLKDIENILKSGADKVLINSAAIENIQLIKAASRIFGSSTICSTIETLKYKNKYFVLKSHGRDVTDKKIMDWALRLQDFGTGEIVITSVDRDGLGEGFDLDIIKKISKNLTVPTIAHGGCGNINQIVNLVSNTNISGVMIASYLHYYYAPKFKKIKFKFGNTAYYDGLKQKFKFDNLILKIKKKLKSKNLNVRT